MRLIELFPEDELLASRLAEGPIRDVLKKTALGGAMAAGLGYGYGAMTTPSQSVGPADQAALARVLQQDPAATATSDEDILGDFIRKGMKVDGGSEIRDGVRDSFPKGLLGLEDVDPDTRVAEFVNHFLPYVESENKRIMVTRQRLIAILNKLSVPRPISRQEREWVQSLYKKYGTDDTGELLKRIDIIPPSLAVAQAALESGWGTAELARSHNVFYGQKSWSKTGVEGKHGERYRAFESPHMSVSAYMLNLNTHQAYSEFRDARAKLRSQGKEPTGISLVGHLGRYSTKGTDYISMVASIIKKRGMYKLDKQVNEDRA